MLHTSDHDALCHAELLRKCMDIAALTEAGAAPGDVVRTRMYITNVDHAEAAGRAHGDEFADVHPTATMVVVAALLDPRWCVEIEAEATIGTGQDS